MNSDTLARLTLALTLSIFATGCTVPPPGAQTASLPQMPPIFSGLSDGPSFTPSADPVVNTGPVVNTDPVTNADPVVAVEPVDPSNTGGALLVGDAVAGQLFGDYYEALNNRRDLESTFTASPTLDGALALDELRRTEREARTAWRTHTQSELIRTSDDPNVISGGAG